MTLAFFGSTFSEDCIPHIQRMFTRLEAEGIEFLLFSDFAEFLQSKMDFKQEHATFSSPEEVMNKMDALISIGGDGTLLKSIEYVRDSGVPVMGLNTGRLGFLSNVAKETINSAIDALLSGNYEIDARSLISLDSSLSDRVGETDFALNEFTVHKKDTSSMVTVQAYINGEYLNTYWADGLVVATPTGSTAYSLSCGGPIMAPDADNFIITPIAAHNMNVRPIVVRDDNIITLKIEGRSDHFLAALDSKSFNIESGREIQLKKADFEVKMVKLKGQSFLDTIRNKLMWGMDKRN